MDLICARRLANLSVREPASRTFKVPEGSMGGSLDQHDSYLHGHTDPMSRVASTAVRTFDMDGRAGSGAGYQYDVSELSYYEHGRGVAARVA